MDLLSRIPIPLLLLDGMLRIRHYTAACGELLGLIPTPLGRTIEDLDWRLEDPNLMDAVRRASAEGASTCDEIEGRDGTPAYLRQVAPCRDRMGRIDGVMVAYARPAPQTRGERGPPVPEHTLARLIEAVPVLIAHVNAAGRYLFSNAAYKDWLGAGTAPIRGRHLREVLGEAAYATLAPHVATVLRGEPVNFAAELPRGDGPPCYVQATYIPDRGRGGEVQGFFAIVTDVTERRRDAGEIERLNKHLREQLAETEAILAAAPIGIFVAHEQDCHDMTMNPAGAAILRLAAPKGPGAMRTLVQDMRFRIMKDGHTLAPEELAMQYAATYDRVVEADELDLVFDDGTSTTVITHAAPLHDEQGQVRGCVGTFVDVSALRRAETALEDVRRRLGHHMENTPLALVEWDTELRIQRWNRAAERLFGWEADEVCGRRLDALPFVHEGDADEVSRIIDALSSGQLDHDTLINRNYRKDGSVVHCEWHNSVLRDARGEVVSVLSLASDVSERVRLEQQLREQAERLAEADRRKDEFLATLGHELRNPLAPIRNAAEILSLSGGEPLTVDWVKQVVTRQTDHMVRLVNDMLDVARITRGVIELDRQSVDIEAIIRAAVEANRDVLHGKGHHFTLELPPHPVMVHADPIRMTQVVGNLIDNAAKYTPQGGHITLRARQNQEQLLLEIEDDGIGIEPEDLPWIFDTFSQARRSLDRAQGGLGLGLALARQIVTLHEGTLEARSDGPDQGSLFTLRMPVMPAGAASEAALRAPASVTDGIKRVLVVDDQKDVADSLEMLIRVLGHSVRCVYDGMGALDAVREFHPQVVLLDLGLPGMDGYEVATHLGELPERATMKVVAMSGYGQEEFRARARAVGFDDYLLKPGELDQIAALLGQP